MEDFSVFRTEVQEVFSLMRYRKDKKKMLHLTLEQALETLEIPVGEHERYRRALEGC